MYRCLCRCLCNGTLSSREHGWGVVRCVRCRKKPTARCNRPNRVHVNGEKPYRMTPRERARVANILARRDAERRAARWVSER